MSETRQRRNWLTKLLFGDISHKYDVLIAALDQNTEEAKDLRKDLQTIAKAQDPLLQLIRNMKEARREENKPETV